MAQPSPIHSPRHFASWALALRLRGLANLTGLFSVAEMCCQRNRRRFGAGRKEDGAGLGEEVKKSGKDQLRPGQERKYPVTGGL